MKLTNLIVLFMLFSCGKPKPILYGDSPSGYCKKRGKIVYHHYKPANIINVNTYAPVQGVDKKTFEVIGIAVGKDKNSVYYKELPSLKLIMQAFDLKKDT